MTETETPRECQRCGARPEFLVRRFPGSPTAIGACGFDLADAVRALAERHTQRTIAVTPIDPAGESLRFVEFGGELTGAALTGVLDDLERDRMATRARRARLGRPSELLAVGDYPRDWAR